MADSLPPPQANPASLPLSLNIRLSAMMFLQYAIWGAWLPILYPFLMGHRGFSLDATGAILAAGAAGAIAGPFIAGQVADRYFSTEKFLGISHVLGAGLVFGLAFVERFEMFLVVSLVYGIIYAPTLALTNSLCFHHLTDRDKQFGPIRLWGTIGWIVAGIAMGHWLLQMHSDGATPELVAAAQNAGRADAFKLSALLGLIMGVFCFTLPHTPPAKNPREASATMEAIKEVRRQPLVTLFLLAIPISIVHQFYFVYTAEFLTGLQIKNEAAQNAAVWINKIFGVGGGGLMTVGQMAEILVLAAIPFFAKKLSRKTLLGIGIAAYALRMAIFAYADSMLAVVFGVALHGLCFGCFIFVAFMVVDEETTADVRASAQNLFNVVIVGVGIAIGSWISTSIIGTFATRDAIGEDGQVVLDEAGSAVTRLDYTTLFSVPMWIALACLLALILFYPGAKRTSIGGTHEPVEPHGGSASDVD